MRFTSELLYRVRALFARDRMEAELDDELSFHIQMETEKLIREEGLEPDEARRCARLRFGGVERTREEVRDARGVRWIEDFVRDVHFGLRGMRKNPVFAGTLVLVLGLAIGANAALFGVADALLLRPLPWAAPGQVVEVYPVDGESGEPMAYTAPDAALTWSEAANFMRGVVFHNSASALYLGGAEPVTLTLEAVSHGFEETLGVRPVLGRGFVAEDAEPGAASVVILADGFWRSAFGADPDVVGRTIELDGAAHRIVGVMPERFKFPTYSSRAGWVPVRRDGTALGSPVRYGHVMGRIAASSVERAQERADALAAGLMERAPRDEGWTVELVPFERPVSDGARRAMAFLAGAVGLILVIAGVNAVHLLMVRGWARTREVAMRRALGASRGRLVRQQLTEAAILALAAGAFAVIAAFVALGAIQGIMPDSISFAAPYAVEVEGRTLAFTFAVAALVGLVVGAVPAYRATRGGAATGGARLTGYAARTPARSRLRRVLIVGEVALSVVLLVGAGLMIRSFLELTRVDPGYRIEDVATLQLRLSAESYPTAEDRGAFVRRLQERLGAVPGVEGVVPSAGVPPGSGFMVGMTLETGDGSTPTEEPGLLGMATAGPDFFDVLDVPVLAGRPLAEADAGTRAVVIDRDLAAYLWGGADPVGRRFRTHRLIRGPGDWYRVVGVVGDLALRGPDDRAGDLEMLLPHDPTRARSLVAMAVATRGDPAELLPSIRAAVHDIDPRQPIGRLAPASEEYAETIDLPRFLLVLMAILSALALALTAFGITGVLAFGVAQRRHEFGVRMALGARAATLSRRVLGEGLGLAALGTALGIVGALALGGIVRSLLFGVEPTDPATIAAVAGVSLLAAAGACYWPARRATRVDPMRVLNAE